MPATEPWKKIARYWQRCRVPIRAGVSAGEIVAFQEKYDVALPPYFAEYLRAVDGTGFDFESDDNMNSFLPLTGVRPVYEVLEEQHGITLPKCFVFMDHSLGIWYYAIEMTADSSGAGPVFRIGPSGFPVEVVASSFREFIEQYAKDPDSIP